MFPGKTLTLSFLFCCALSLINAQQISNITAAESGKQIIVTYDLIANETGQQYSVKLFVSENSGKTWQGPLQKVSGAVGEKVSEGRGKTITWDVLAERDGIDGNNIQFKIQAEKEKTVIYKNERFNDPKINNTNSDWKVKSNGFTNITELNFGGGNLRPFSFGIQTTNAYIFNPYFSVGIGVGVINYGNGTYIISMSQGNYNSVFKDYNGVYSSNIIIPLFIDFRLRINYYKAKVSQFLSLGIGYSLGTKHISHDSSEFNIKGGVFLNPGFGIKFNVAKQIALTLGIGYTMQYLVYSGFYYHRSNNYYSPGQPYLVKYSNGRNLGYPNLKLGVIF